MTVRGVLLQTPVAATLLLVLMSGSFTASYAAVPDRILMPISNSNLTKMQGNVHPMVRASTDLGPVEGSTKLGRIQMIFSLTPAQQASLDALLQSQEDPHSSDYHKWLTPEQYGERFGLSPNDISKLATWLQEQGFGIVEVSRSRTYLAFSGTASQVESAFHTQIHQYSVHGELRYANAGEPSLPTALIEVVSAITGLNNFRPRPQLAKPRPRVTSSVTGNHFIAPGDFAILYDLNTLYSSGIDGTGQTIAVMGQTDLVKDSSGNYTDVVTFRSNSGLSAPNLTSLLIPGAQDPGIVSGDIDEANLDVEWSGAVAKNAAILFVIGNPTTGGGAFDALPYTVANNLAPVISISYGICEPQLDSASKSSLTSAGQEANAQGQTIVAATGDSGAADCDDGAKSASKGLAVDFPASMPYSTAMGGNEFTGDAPNSSSPCAPTQYWGGGLCSVSDTTPTALSYIPEMVWNDTAADMELSAGGGGLSTLFSQPSWQSGLSAITNGMRGVPDLSFSSSADHDGYLICSRGSCVCGFRNSCTISGSQGTFDAIGGTSAAVPTFAAVVALTNQKIGARQGNVNSAIYTLAVSQPYVFHDITVGDNKVPCTQGTTDCPDGGSIGYTAGPGYDLASGLGSVDVAALVSGLSQTSYPNFELTAASDSLTINGGNFTTDVVTLTPEQGFSDGVNLVCNVASALTGVTCAVSPAGLSGGSGTATVTINTTAGVTASGAIAIQALSASNPSLSQVVQLAVTVHSPDFTLLAANQTMSLSSGGLGNDALTIGSNYGFSGQVALTCAVSSGLGATTCSVSPSSVTGSGTATLSVTGATLSAALRTPPRFSCGMWAIGSGFFLAAMVMLPGRRKPSRAPGRRSQRITLSLMVMSLLLGIASCGGGGGSGSPAQSAPTPLTGFVTVTGSSGSLSHPVVIAVTID